MDKPRLVMARFTPADDDTRDFDVEFWQKLGSTAIFEAAEEMVRMATEVRGLDQVNSHCKDLLRVLDRHGVRYLIVGAYPAMKTERTYKKDLDVWVDPAPANAQNVFRALAEFGVPVAGLSPSDFTQPAKVFQMGVDPVRIDVLLGIADLEFAAAWGRRQVFDIGGLPVTYLSTDDMIAASRVEGRAME